jgi:nitric oxide synthase oxygenase domain/subunit
MIFVVCREEEFLPRWETILSQMTTTGTYNLDTDELDHAVKMAWRNATRCSARIQWNKLVNSYLYSYRSTAEKLKKMCT